MGTVNFSVPDDIKAAFNDAFAGQNKSAVIAELMQQAVDARRRQRRRAKAVERLLAVRRTARPASARKVRATRVKDRP